MSQQSLVVDVKKFPCPKCLVRMNSSLTHAAKLGEVLLGSLLLLVLVDPLVKVGLEEVDLLGLLEQAGPVLLLELLLLELQLNVLARVVDLALLRVNLAVQLEVEVEVLLQGVGVAVKGQARGLEVELEAGGGDVRDGDGQVDEVLGGVGGAGALGPEDWRPMLVPSWSWPPRRPSWC